ncbi:MAG: ATP-binding cassette subfamily F protein uup [Planctomycetota bacterium]|jgi:ATP-binding cassette subfamily F protein uup
MAELGLSGVSLSFGAEKLLNKVDLQVEKGERIALVGRNGCGKSSLLRLIAGELDPETGEVSKRQGLVIGNLPQEVPRDFHGTVIDLCASGVTHLGVPGDWEVDKRIERELARFGLEGSLRVEDQSAGTKRRALLARAMVSEPDLLLLDEPTNHLDVQAITSMEESLVRRGGTLMLVTHDRRFLRRVATRILDLDRGRLESYRCDYETFIERREERLEAEQNQAAEFDKKLAKEEAWLRRGVKARRTRDMGRVRRLSEMREQFGERRDRSGRAQGQLVEAERSGRLVLRAKGLAQAYDDKALFKGLNLEVQRGDRLGIVGPNGCGKTTLLKILLGQLEAQSGTVDRGTKLELARFDQLHDTLDEDATVRENVSANADTVTVGGRSRHIIGYLRDFLFNEDQIKRPVRLLSGGERNRVQLARILTKPCNLLVLDEPTNDLDIETLELLEEILLGYDGTLLLVSHDREFLDNVVTSTLVFDGEGGVREQVGGLGVNEDLPVNAAASKASKSGNSASKAAASSPKKPESAARARKLTYKEKIELEKLPDRIGDLESARDKLTEAMSQPDAFKRPGDQIAADSIRLAELEKELATAYARWEELESLPTR